MPLLIPGDPYGVTLTGDPYGVTVTGDPTGGVPLPEFPVASGGVVLPALTADGAAERHVMASAAVMLPAFTAAGAAERIATAAGASILPPIISGGVASLTKTAAGAIALPALTADGVAAGGNVKLASGAIVLPAMTGDGATALGRVAAGAVTLPAFVADGAAERAVVASGAVALPAFTAGGAAERTVAASGAVALPAMTAGGAAERTVGASGAVTLPALTADGATALQRGASGAVTLPAIAMGGDAERVVAAAGAVSLPAMTADGAATADAAITASGAITLPAFTADGAATAGGAAAFPVVETTSSGQVNFADPAPITLPSGVTSGDLLVVAFTINNAGGLSIDAGSAAGWTELAEGTRGSSTGHAVYYKVSNGTDSLSVDLATNGRGTWIALRISGASGNVEATSALSTFSGSPDTTSLTPSWGSKKTLWLSSIGGGTHRTISAAPSGYSHVYQGGIASTFTFSAVGYVDAEATSEDPGAWSLSGSTDVVGFTIAVEPS